MSMSLATVVGCLPVCLSGECCAGLREFRLCSICLYSYESCPGNGPLDFARPWMSPARTGLGVVHGTESWPARRYLLVCEYWWHAAYHESPKAYPPQRPVAASPAGTEPCASLDEPRLRSCTTGRNRMSPATIAYVYGNVMSYVCAYVCAPLCICMGPTTVSKAIAIAGPCILLCGTVSCTIADRLGMLHKSL